MKPLRHLIQWVGVGARRMARHADFIQALAGIIALSLGLWGWSIKAPPADGADWFNNAFRTLQLITLQFPTSLEAAIPWQLQAARLLLPLCAALATFHILLGSITRPLRLALLPYTRGHIILCGNEQVTGAALEALAKRDREIVTLAPVLDPVRRDALEGMGLTCAEGDPLLPETFIWLNVKSAAALFLTHAEDLTNLNIAMRAMEHAKTRSPEMEPLLLGVLLEDEALAMELDAALDGIARKHNLRYHRLCPDREGLRQEMRRFAPVLLKPDRAQRSHVLVAGLAGRWEQVLAQLITAAQDHPELTPRLTLLLDEAEQAGFEAWRAARPELPLVAEFAVLPPRSQAAPEGWEAPHLMLVLRPDGEAVATALALRRPGHPLGTERVPVLVRQSREDHLLSRLATTEVQGRDMTGFVAFGGLLRAESLERVLDRRGDAVAIALHAHYLDAAAQLGAGSPVALAAWDGLPENLRDANRAAAEHAPILFAAAGLRLEASGTPAVLGEAEVEMLARVEHRRWMADRIERGWRFGAKRDNDRLLHPNLVPFDALEAKDQEKDRAQVRAMVEVLGLQGLVVVRPQLSDVVPDLASP